MDNYLISIVMPVYNEENQIGESLRIVQDLLNKNNINHEFILVDDGSKDGSWNKITESSKTINNLKAIKLSRNFGKEFALCAALNEINSDACIVMDCDLQHPPEIIPQMVKLWKEGYDVVEGVKISRGKEKLTNKIGAYSFYNILKKLSGIDLNRASDFKLLDKKVISAWKQMGEYNTFFRGMSAWVGYKRITIPFVVADRASGVTKWSIIHLFQLALNAITSFSSLPLYVVTILGLIFLMGAFVLAIQTIYMKISHIAVNGFTTVILLLLIIGSILMICLGIIGIYIAKIYDEVKNRPRYLITEKIDNSEH